MNLSRQRTGFALEVNPRYYVVAALGNWPDRPTEIVAMAEFDHDDRAGLQAWIRERSEGNFASVHCAFYPGTHILTRDSVQARRLNEPNFLSGIVKEKFYIEDPDNWHIHLIDPLEGSAVSPEGPQRPVLFSCVPHSMVRDLQQQLLDMRLMPVRMEIGTLPLVAALMHYKATRNDSRATFVIELESDRTRVAILGKEGLHTPTQLKIGVDAIVQAAIKEYHLPDLQAARDHLRNTPTDLAQAGRRLVRALASELRPIVYSYEMTTGQRIGECYCSFLSKESAWIGSVLAESLDLEPLQIDLNEWHFTVGLRANPGVRLAPHWLGLLSLIAELPKSPGNDG